MRWTVIEHQGKSVHEGPSVVLGVPGGTIGRSPDNHLVLPDAQRQISRLQATVRIDANGAGVLHNMSAVLPVSVNGQTLRHNEELAVQAGDRVVIGSYVLRVDPAQGADAAAPAATGGMAVTASTQSTAPAPQLASTFPSPAADSDVFADLFGNGALPLTDIHGGAAPATAPSMAPARATPSPAIDWDTVLANAPRRMEAEDDADAPTADPLAHEPFSLPSQAQRNTDDPLAALQPAWGPGSDLGVQARGTDPLALFTDDDPMRTAFSDPRPTVIPEADARAAIADTHPTSALGLDGSAPAASSSPRHAVDRGSALSSEFQPPPQRAQKARSAEAAPAATTAEPSADHPAPPSAADALVPPVEPQASAAATQQAEAPHDVGATAPASQHLDGTPSELLAAFFEGAGIAGFGTHQALDAEGMRRIGRLMRAFTDGTLELLSSRALLKREVRAEITMIVDEENNPFKILPNGRAVLMQMFGAHMPGFIAPEAAVHDALADLHAHQLGMMAGMRAALLALLSRFNPQSLEAGTPHDGGVGEKWLPGGREARLWREMSQLHARTTAAVQDDFQAVFGKAFQEAYDHEMARLRDERRA